MNKTLCLIFAFFFFYNIAIGQNLIPNASFEEFDSCPEFSGEIEKATGWRNFKLSPDYFNSCNNTGLGVPHNLFTDNTDALHGNAYAGFAQIGSTLGHGEIIAIELSSPLEVGVSYYVSLSVIRGTPSSSNCWANKIGAKFTMIGDYLPWPLNLAMPVTNSAHVYTDELVEDTENWTTINGYFTADSAYRFLVIGNHFHMDSLNIVCDQSYNSFQAYYFLDCVCVSKSPETCLPCDVLLDSQNEEKVIERAFPNPFEGYVIIENLFVNQIQAVEFWTIDGKLIHEKIDIQNVGKGIMINTNQVNKGFYYLILRLRDGDSKSFKIIKLKS